MDKADVFKFGALITKSDDFGPDADAGQIEILAIWGTNGTAITVNPVGMHVDPVLPHSPVEFEGQTPLFEDPLFG